MVKNSPKIFPKRANPQSNSVILLRLNKNTESFLQASFCKKCLVMKTSLVLAASPLHQMWSQLPLFITYLMGRGRGRRKFPVPFLTRWVTISKHQSIPESEWNKKRKRLQGLPPWALLRTMENQEPPSCWLHFPTPPHTGTQSMWTTDHNQADNQTEELTTQFFCFPKY